MQSADTIKIHDGNNAPKWADWLELEPFRIEHSSWDVGTYRPYSEARLLLHNDVLHVRLASFEPDQSKRRAVCATTGGPVHLDSCLEAFISFSNEEDAPYFNFEFNSLGTAHVGIGSSRHGRTLLSASEIADLRVNCMIDINTEGEYEAGWWQIHFQIPSSWLAVRIGEAAQFEEGKVIRANFYKCGDETPDPHYLSWAPIGTPTPDFHQPTYFRFLKLVR